ncbi:hypothetical protein EVAR_88823_1 [Eumeta japonica]|uniref:Uncharacterized protein n=1 Tax=Eumeta variegata TaxID=151549 RepID=A0A4C1Y7V8_EUMVA|nr:hypothetical protein EVAR_88823_1 [Eumeta japonica]
MTSTYCPWGLWCTVVVIQKDATLRSVVPNSSEIPDRQLLSITRLLPFTWDRANWTHAREEKCNNFLLTSLVDCSFFWLLFIAFEHAFVKLSSSL